MKKSLLILFLLLTFGTVLFAQSKTDMVKVTNNFLESLSTHEKSNVIFKMDDSEVIEFQIKPSPTIQC